MICQSQIFRLIKVFQWLRFGNDQRLQTVINFFDFLLAAGQNCLRLFFANEFVFHEFILNMFVLKHLALFDISVAFRNDITNGKKLDKGSKLIHFH